MPVKDGRQTSKSEDQWEERGEGPYSLGLHRGAMSTTAAVNKTTINDISHHRDPLMTASTAPASAIKMTSFVTIMSP